MPLSSLRVPGLHRPGTRIFQIAVHVATDRARQKTWAQKTAAPPQTTTVAMGLAFHSSASPSPNDNGPSLPARLQYHINKLTKWVVSASVFASLVLRGFDTLTQWYVVGGVMSAIICRFLKFAINASRPGSSYRSDPGMPSSHASTLGFLSVFPYVVMSDNRYAWLLPASGGFLAYLRVSQGYHTYAQVIVGWLLGTAIAVAWREAGQVALPYLAETVAGRLCLAASCLFFAGLFTVKNVMYVLRYVEARPSLSSQRLLSQAHSLTISLSHSLYARTRRWRRQDPKRK